MSQTMHARSPAAFALSALLHGVFVAVMFFGAYAVRDSLPPPAHIIELVAGDGDNWEATEAPALGSPNPTVKIDIPETPAAPVAPPEPVVQPVVTAVEPPKPEPKKPEPKPIDLVKNLDRKMDSAQAKTEAKIEKQRKLEQQQYAKFLEQNKKLNPSQKKSSVKPDGKPVRIDTEGIATGVQGGSTKNKTGGAGGKVLNRAEQDALDTYLKRLEMKVSEAHEKPFGVSEQHWAKLICTITVSGTITNVKITQSSGNKEFDESALAAMRKVRPIGAVPGGQAVEWPVLFEMKDS